MKHLSDSERERLRKEIADYHAERLKKIAHNIDREWKADNRLLLPEAKPRARTIFGVALIASSIALLLVGLVLPSSLGFTSRIIIVGLVIGLLCCMVRK